MNRPQSRARIVGVDTGGTFTDVVFDDGRSLKIPSTPDDPSRAVALGAAQTETSNARADRTPPAVLAHGTTVATNTLLQRHGARVALVTNAGFEDVIEIARQDRPSLYDPDVVRPEPLVPPELRLGVAGRLAADGTVLEPVFEADVPAVPGDVDAVAVCLLHGDLEPAHELVVERALSATGRRAVFRSSAYFPEYREYERTVTTVVNAYLAPACQAYLERLAPLAGEVFVMTSAGGLVDLSEAKDRPVALLLSGPAAGAEAAAVAAVAAGFPDAVTFDMGGTSTDVCLVRDGVPDPASQRSVAGFPIRVPSLDIHTIGAGGGSIARIDAGGALRVGPESAGARPGPACYGQGGTAPTVADADLVAGLLPAGIRLPGIGTLDREAAAAALADAGLDQEAVIAVVEAAMVAAIRVVSLERGVDPRHLALVAFGGAGPLHACALAEALGMAAVVVPPRAGVLSAVGLLCSSPQVDLVRSWPTPGSTVGLDEALAGLAAEASRRLGRTAKAADAGEREGVDEVEVEVALDCRYAGQGHELTVGGVERFAAEHERRNGFSRPDWPIEVIALRARARRPPLVRAGDIPPVGRAGPVKGPASILEPDCTVHVPTGWTARTAAGGAWVLER